LRSACTLTDFKDSSLSTRVDDRKVFRDFTNELRYRLSCCPQGLVERNFQDSWCLWTNSFGEFLNSPFHTDSRSRAFCPVRPFRSLITLSFFDLVEQRIRFDPRTRITFRLRLDSTLDLDCLDSLEFIGLYLLGHWILDSFIWTSRTHFFTYLVEIPQQLASSWILDLLNDFLRRI
jgi:hypothetical protein